MRILRGIKFILTFLTVAQLTCIAGAQIVIPPGVLEKIPPKKIPPRTVTTNPAGKKVDIQRLVINFRRAAGDVEKRKAAADKLLELGPRGAKILRSIIASDLPRRVASYKKAFYNKARSIGLKKLAAADSKQTQAWQEQFKSLGSITKETLRSKAGPAMDGLYKALVPTRQEVLEGSKALAARREEILAMDTILTRSKVLLGAKSTIAVFPKTIEQQEKLISLMCTYMPDAGRKSIEADLKQFTRMGFEEWHGFVHLNVVRMLLGLRPMRINLKLSAAALDHSKDMARHKFFNHTSPVAGKKTPWDRAARQGAKSNGECIAAGMSSGPGAIRCWFFSPGHHKLIMSRSSRVGIGGYSRKWTLMTGR
ncbi:MAG: CAP domain-containing protein [Phycisphaerae bacterium]|jgi:hypothetical protein|nr:CAP domain-containing protein [Phycisphaerae bacterium]